MKAIIILTEGNVQYDIIFDVVAKRVFSDCRKVLKPNGVFISTLPNPDVILQIALTAFLPGQKVKFVLEKPNAQDLMYLKGLIEAGKMRTVIDRAYPLQELAAAHQYSENERTVGKIAIATLPNAIAYPSGIDVPPKLFYKRFKSCTFNYHQMSIRQKKHLK